MQHMQPYLYLFIYILAGGGEPKIQKCFFKPDVNLWEINKIVTHILFI
jgi:hypothetical protein